MKQRIFLITPLALSCILSLGCRKISQLGQEDRKQTLRLTLDFVRTEWRVGEQPWYRLQFTNAGKNPITIFDGFWLDQSFLGRNSDNRENTYFEILGPDGNEVRPSFFMEWGSHGEYRFWVNDCGGEVCNPPNDGIARAVEPGETVTATPSRVAPLRKSTGTGLLDARVSPGASPDERNAHRKLWEIQERNLEATGRKPRRFGPANQPHPISGYRILEGYHFRTPGKYKIKAIYDHRYWKIPISAEEEISQYGEMRRRAPDPKTRAEIMGKWQRMSEKDLEWYRRMRAQGDDRRKRIRPDPNLDQFLIESNPVELFIIP